jgi:hypothetical protein
MRARERVFSGKINQFTSAVIEGFFFSREVNCLSRFSY